MGTAADIVGRTVERARLASVRRSAAAGAPAAVLLTGDAGVGKSTVLGAEIDDARRDGWQVQIGHCVELAGGAVPFGPVAEVVRHVVVERGTGWIEEVTGALAGSLDPLLRGTGLPGSTDRPGMLAALVATVESLAQSRPLLLAVEDVHWADRSTLDVLDLLIRTAAEVPLFVVATLRGDELHRRHPTRGWAAELVRHPRVEQLELAPFSPADLATLIERIDGRPADPRVVRELHRRTDGNAFFAEVLLSTPAESRHRLPERLSDVLLARLDALAPAARRVVDVAAAAARRIDHRLLEAVAGLDTGDLRAGLREALDAGVLVRTDDGTAYRLRHALLREVAHDELLPGERVELHRALAAALERAPELAGSPTGPHGELAYHWWHAHDHARTYRASLAAAREARTMAAYAEALEHTERALELHEVVDDDVRGRGPRRDRLLHDAGMSAFTAGLPGTAMLRAAADEARRVDAPVADVLQSLLRLAYAEWAGMDGDVAIAVAEEAVALAEDANPVLLVHALGELARLQLLIGRVAVARPLAERAVTLAATVDAPEGESVARNSLAIALASDGRTEEAVAELRTALKLARSAGDHVEIGRAVTNLTHVLSDAGRVDEAEQALGELATAVRNPEGMAGHLAFARLNVASGLLDELRLDEAAAHISAVGVAGRYGVVEQYVTLARAQLALHTGELTEARRLGAQARERLGGPLPDLQSAGPVIDVVVWSALLDGDAPAALRASAWLLRMADQWEGAAMHPSWQLGVRAAVAVALDARTRGDHRTAEETAELAHRWARRGAEEADARESRPDPAWTARLAATRAVLARLDRTAADVWQQVAADLGGARGLWRAQIAVEAATDLAAAGRGPDALRPLADAGEELGRLPATHPLAVTAAALRAGADTGEDALLTPRELEVISLVAQGRTNREIGETLFVSEKTASVHVSNILRKLDVANRVEAAAAARRLGLVHGL